MLQQTLREIEKNCIDDCSTDGARDILHTYIKKDPKCKKHRKCLCTSYASIYLSAKSELLTQIFRNSKKLFTYRLPSDIQKWNKILCFALRAYENGKNFIYGV